MKIDSTALTLATAAAVAAAGEAAIRGGDALIDFAGVVRCDSSAVACLLAWQRTARAAGVSLQVLALPKDLASLANLYGVRGLIGAA